MNVSKFSNKIQICRLIFGEILLNGKVSTFLIYSKKETFQ